MGVWHMYVNYLCVPPQEAERCNDMGNNFSINVNYGTIRRGQKKN